MTTATGLTDVDTLRSQARKHIEQGAVTAGYSADRTTVLKLLNEALATEIVCVLRYRRHHRAAGRRAGLCTGPLPAAAMRNTWRADRWSR